MTWPVSDDTGEFRIGAQLAVNLGFPMHALDPRSKTQGGNFQSQSVAGNDGLTKSRFPDAGKEHQFLIAIGDFAQGQNCPALRQSFDHQNARHYRRPGKMAFEKLFVSADLFDADDSLERL